MNQIINHKNKYYLKTKNGYKEILSSTDVSLGLPQPSQQFIEKYIEEYNRGNIITDVFVEYENKFDEYGYDIIKSILKINPKDNTITIKKVKETYTREELYQILEKYTSFIWSEVGIHYPISLGNNVRVKFINREL